MEEMRQAGKTFLIVEHNMRVIMKLCHRIVALDHGEKIAEGSPADIAGNARVVEASITWDYTTWLNIAFLILAGLLVWRFLKTGGPAMLRMMNRPAAMGHTH